jgi:hypothetical protein
MYDRDRHHLSAITRIFVDVVAVLSTMTQHKYVPLEQKARGGQHGYNADDFR